MFFQFLGLLVVAGLIALGLVQLVEILHPTKTSTKKRK